MSPLDPRNPETWSQWTASLQQAQQSWLDWWQRTLGSTALTAPSVDTPPASTAPSTMTPDVAAATTRFREKWAALWQAALDLGSTAGMLPEIADPHGGDRRFKGEAWRG